MSLIRHHRKGGSEGCRLGIGGRWHDRGGFGGSSGSADNLFARQLKSSQGHGQEDEYDDHGGEDDQLDRETSLLTVPGVGSAINSHPDSRNS
jgi:hypothetical protein